MKFEAYKAVRRFSVWAVKVIALVFLGVVTYRIANCHPNIDFSKFDFSDLLALIMALFAIGLSVAFYFKSTDTSNQFYDNTYKFTEDTAKILGRIEAGFGERLRHMDEGYNLLTNRIDKLKVAEESQVEEIEQQQEIVKDKDKQYEQAMNELLQKSKIEANEKEKLRTQLQKAEEEKANAQGRLHALEADRMSMLEQLKRLNRRAMGSNELGEFHSIIRQIISEPFIKRLIQAFLHGDNSKLDDIASIIKKQYPEYTTLLKESGFMDSNGKLTSKGLEAIIEAYQRHC
jgi:hypothetical protein